MREKKHLCKKKKSQNIIIINNTNDKGTSVSVVLLWKTASCFGFWNQGKVRRCSWKLFFSILSPLKRQISFAIREKENLKLFSCLKLFTVLTYKCLLLGKQEVDNQNQLDKKKKTHNRTGTPKEYFNKQIQLHIKPQNLTSKRPLAKICSVPSL